MSLFLSLGLRTWYQSYNGMVKVGREPDHYSLDKQIAPGIYQSHFNSKDILIQVSGFTCLISILFIFLPSVSPLFFPSFVCFFLLSSAFSSFPFFFFSSFPVSTFFFFLWANNLNYLALLYKHQRNFSNFRIIFLNLCNSIFTSYSQTKIP